MEFTCPKCGHHKYYLQEKGNNTGVYCDKCCSWVTWIGKKDIAYFERQAERFLKPVSPINVESVTGLRGVSENDPVGPENIPSDYLHITAAFDEIITKLQQISEHIQDISEDMQASTRSYQYHSKLLNQKMRESLIQGEEDDVPPWD